MRVLLDTHSFLWFVLDDLLLSENARRLIAEPDNEILLSPASYWEITINITVGKYSLDEPFQQFFDDQIARNDFLILHVAPKHAAPLTSLPFHHRDPFDRLIIAQAMVEQIPIVSSAPVLDDYGVNRLW